MEREAMNLMSIAEVGARRLYQMYAAEFYSYTRERMPPWGNIDEAERWYWITVASASMGVDINRFIGIGGRHV